MQKRSIGLAILLSIITVGIYGIYWFVKITNEANEASGEADKSGGVAFLLTIITCGIYGYFWAYRMGQKIQKAKANRNIADGDSNLPVIYLVLNICGLSIVTIALIQNELNKMAEA